MKVISVCLSDIPKDKISKSEKNGKSYVSIVVDDRRTPDQFGNDQTVYINQTKEERTAKTDKIYVGQGKSYDFQNSKPQSKPAVPISIDANDDLPF